MLPQHLPPALAAASTALLVVATGYVGRLHPLAELCRSFVPAFKLFRVEPIRTGTTPAFQLGQFSYAGIWVLLLRFVTRIYCCPVCFGKPLLYVISIDETKQNHYCSLMAANSRFAVGVHCMLALAALGEDGSTAEFLAGSVDTNPVVVRRVLKTLEKAGHVEIRPGKGGGVRLRRAPEDITLAQILEAVEPETQFFAYHAAEPNPQCRVSCEIRNLLEPIFQRVDRVVHDTLAETRLSDLLHRLRS